VFDAKVFDLIVQTYGKKFIPAEYAILILICMKHQKRKQKISCALNWKRHIFVKFVHPDQTSFNYMEIIDNSFYEFAAILLLTAMVSLAGRFLRQPLVVSFIAVGVLVGPFGLDLLKSIEQIHLLSELGIAILLFVVGLKLDLTLVKSIGKVATLTGLGQVLFTSVIGYFIGLQLGFDHLTSLYIAIALTFSSTIIIVKLLSDKKEIDSLHGQISIGFLIIQDLVVVLLMIALSAMGTESSESPAMTFLFVALKGLGLLAFVGLLMRYVLPWLVNKLARTPELLILFAMAWALSLSAFGDFLGFSKEVGAFLAGISLASTEYREVLSGRMATLRDFLLLFFFLHLGSTLDLGIIGDQILPAVLFSLFVLIGNPLIVLVIMGIMGYRKRTAFLAGLTVAQISEFSLILAALGMSLGHIDETTMGLITLVGLITIGLSTYLILYSHQIYNVLSPALSVFEKAFPKDDPEIATSKDDTFDVILFGLGRYGHNIARELELHERTILGVDFDPKVIDLWRAEGRKAMYGDADDPDLPSLLPLKNSKVIISTITDYQMNLFLLKYLKAYDYQGRVILTQHSTEKVEVLMKEGADFVLLPFADAVDNIIEKLNCDVKPEKDAS
jgi:Kef-type K+ transport system membrane component KefB